MKYKNYRVKGDKLETFLKKLTKVNGRVIAMKSVKGGLILAVAV